MNARGFKTYEAMGPIAGRVEFEIRHNWIIRKDLAPFLMFWDLDRIAAAGRLPDVLGKVLFYVAGYAKDPRPICEIPEVRAYLRELVEEWPFFFFADNLETQFLWSLIQCAVPRLSMAASTVAPGRYIARIEPEDINHVYGQLVEGLGHIWSMDSRFTVELFKQRIKQVESRLRKMEYRPPGQ